MTPPEDGAPVAVRRHPRPVESAEATPAELLASKWQARRERMLAARAAEEEAEAAALTDILPEPKLARAKPRHYALLASFALLVLAPFAASVWYLYARAADQYHSEVAFSIRSEQAGAAAAGLLGALTQIGSGSASDANIINEFIGSQKIVEEINAEIDLRAIFNRPEGDPVFTLGRNPSIEALLREWRRMVTVSYEPSTGIIHVRANTFTPGDARTIANAILAQSGALVNRLSDQAREDAVSFAREELAESETNLRVMRQKLADFRRDNRLVDPAADAAGQMGLLNALQGQLAQGLVDRDVLLSYADPGDQRVIQVNRRIDAITERIEEERASLGIAGPAGTLPDVLGAYEELQVDLEFANKAYVQSLAALTAARAEARRQSRYLLPHIQPTLAMTSLYPRRPLLAGLTGLFLLLGWGIAVLVYYNVRDNR
jgi:capsular polysaccharide transport system permease protein